MHRATKLVPTVLAATMVLAAAVGTASARRLELSSQRFRAVWQSAPMIFESNGAGRAICPVTMEGSFHSRTLSKVSGQLIGYVTQAARGECGVAGGATALTLLTQMLPWHISYSGFRGTLPNITRINVNVIGVAFLITLELAGSCLYKSTVASPALLEFEVGAGGVIATLAANSTTQIPRSAGGLLCPAEATLANAGLVTVQGSETTRITVRLVQ